MIASEVMMFKNPWFLFSMCVFLFLGSCVYMFTSSVGNLNPNQNMTVNEDSILYLELDGVIMDIEDLLEDLRKYGKEDKIKGLVLRVNSPGGVVGPSQELYSELKRISTDLEKPVYISANAIMASGAYYAAVAADKIYVNSGTLMGSIGVIMEFANLSRLYDWAKVERYSIKTGKFKNTGTDTRAMRDDEKEYLESVIQDVYGQFKQAVADGRKLKLSEVEPYADGRIFTGSYGVKIGFADKVGGLSDVLRDIGEATGLGSEPNVFYPHKNKDFWMEVAGRTQLFQNNWEQKVERLLGLKLQGKPLFLYPAFLGE